MTADTITIADRQTLLAAGQRRFENVDAPGVDGLIKIRSMTGREFQRHLDRLSELDGEDDEAFLSAVYLLQDSICDAEGELMFRTDTNGSSTYAGQDALAALPHGAVVALTQAIKRLNGKHADPEDAEKN